MLMMTTTTIMMTIMTITTIEVEWAALSPPKPNLSLLGATFKVEKIEKMRKNIARIANAVQVTI